MKLWLLSMIFLSTLVHAGGNELGNGTDNPPIQGGGAWFLGSGKVIRACFSISPEFNITPTVAMESAQNAFQKWVQYINDKSLNTIPVPNELKYATQISIAATCAGNEDLTIYFGGTSPAIVAASAQFNNPVAFAELVSSQLNIGWAKGFIWINSNLARTDLGDTASLTPDSLLLHEFGHVFGCAHVPGTVMDADLANLVFSGQYTADESTRIDSKRELIMKISSSLLSSGSLGDGTVAGSTAVFTELFNSAPQSQTSISASLNCPDVTKTCTLNFLDGGKSYALPIQMLGSYTTFFGGDIFKTVIVTDPNLNYQDFFSESYGKIYYANLTTPSGAIFNLVFEWNMVPNVLESYVNRIRYFGKAGLTNLYTEPLK